MKVWIVAHDVESCVIGVFDSEEKAKAALEKQRDNEWFDCYEYTLNETANTD